MTTIGGKKAKLETESRHRKQKNISKDANKCSIKGLLKREHRQLIERRTETDSHDKQEKGDEKKTDGARLR